MGGRARAWARKKWPRPVARATSSARLSPSFLVIGEMKCGTTSLFWASVPPPSVLPPYKKEVFFFDVKYDRGESWYRSHFPLARRAPIDGDHRRGDCLLPLPPARARSDPHVRSRNAPDRLAARPGGASALALPARREQEPRATLVRGGTRRRGRAAAREKSTASSREPTTAASVTRPTGASATSTTRTWPVAATSSSSSGGSSSFPASSSSCCAPRICSSSRATP